MSAEHAGRTRPGRATRAEVLLVVAVTVVFGLVLTLWAYLTPSLHGPDELANVDAAIQLAMGHAWPSAGGLHYIQGLLAQNVPAMPPPAADRGTFAEIVGDGTLNALVNPMSQHPPTYFLVQAAVAHVLDFAGRRWDLVVLAMRLVDVAVVLPVPALVWAAVRRSTRSPRLGVAAAVALLAVPQLVQLGSSVSVWAPLITAGALATWLGVRVLTGDRSWWTALALGGSLAVGTALMSGGIMAIPFALAAVLFARGTGGTGGTGGAGTGANRVLRALVVLAVPAATTGWWYLRQLVRTGTPQPDAFPATTQPWPRFESPAPTQFAGAFWDGLSQSFWGSFGRYEWSLSPILVDTLTIVTLAVVVWASTRRTADRRALLLVGLFPAAAIVVVVARDWGTYAGHLGVTVNQGRFLFPAVVALLVVQAVAWSSLVVSPVVRTRLARGALVAAPLIGAVSLVLLCADSYGGLRALATRSGIGAMGVSLPAGLAPFAALLVLTAVLGLAAAVLAWRWFGRATGPSSGLPLNSEPSVEPTQRNNP